MSFKARWSIKSVCFVQFMVCYRIKPENSVWFEDAKLKNLIICQPENRNRFNKIFGGFIMRQAFELAWANAFTFRFNQNLIQLLNYWHFFFSKSRPFCMHMDDILFKAPVEVGNLLYFNSQICYTQDNYVQTRVSAEVFNSIIIFYLICSLGLKSQNWGTVSNKCVSLYISDQRE